MTGSSTEHETAPAEARAKLAGLEATFAEFTAVRAESELLRAARRDAFARFAALGLPTRQNEEWKYTSLRGFDETPWQIAAAREKPAATFSAATLEALLNDGEHMLVIDDGILSTSYSKLGALPAGVRITPLAEALAGRDDVLEFVTQEHAFEALNMAFADSGFVIEIDRKVRLEKPLHIVHLAAAPDVARFPRIVIRLGETAEATVLETHVSAPGVRSFTAGATTIALAAGARLLHAKMQNDSEQAFHVTSTRATLARDAHLASYVFTLGGKVTRNDLDVVLTGAGAAATLDGFYVANGKRHVDNHTVIDHRVPNTTSNQLYKGILGDAARAVFNGKVFVRKDAQQTAAYQLNKNLLLSSDAEIDTKPQLEIDADDVKCAHGAAVGPLDADQIFYLESRGIPRDVAVRMLALGFADEVLLRFPIPSHRERFRKLLPQ